MENYTRGKCVEQPFDRAAIPIPNLPNDFLWMQVKSGSKMQKLTDHALGVLNNNESKCVVWTGSGEGVIRAIACAEAIKRTRPMFQITKIAYRKCEEFWEPKLEGLDRIVVDRDIPIVHILLSIDSLDDKEPGYQSPNTKDAFWNTQFRSFQSTGKKRSKVKTEEIASMGLQTKFTGPPNSSKVKTKKT